MSCAQSPAGFRDEPRSVRLTVLRWIGGNAERRSTCRCRIREALRGVYTRTLCEISRHVQCAIITDYSREWSPRSRCRSTRNATRLVVAPSAEAIVVTDRSLESRRKSASSASVALTHQRRSFRHESESRWKCGDVRHAGLLLVGLVPGDPGKHEMKARVASTSRDVIVGTDWMKWRGPDWMRTVGEMFCAAIGASRSSRRRSLMLLTAIACCCWLVLVGECAGQKPINLGGSKKRDVYIAGFFPYGAHVPEGHIGRGVMPAVKLAVEHINEHPTILRDYRLHMWWNDTEVSFLSSPRDTPRKDPRALVSKSLNANLSLRSTFSIRMFLPATRRYVLFFRLSFLLFSNYPPYTLFKVDSFSLLFDYASPERYRTRVVKD